MMEMGNQAAVGKEDNSGDVSAPHNSESLSAVHQTADSEKRSSKENESFKKTRASRKFRSLADTGCRPQSIPCRIM